MRSKIEYYFIYRAFIAPFVGDGNGGKKVLLVDTDPQASLTISLGNPVPDELFPTLSDMMEKIMMKKLIASGEGILHHSEGVDCMPSLGMLTVNALAAADNVLIPVQAAYLPAKGLEQLLETTNKIRLQINLKLKIEGILLTMVDGRTNYSKEISSLIRESYSGKLKVYKTDIPRSIRAEEISAEGQKEKEAAKPDPDTDYVDDDEDYGYVAEDEDDLDFSDEEDNEPV